jgi:hypothetical protein
MREHKQTDSREQRVESIEKREESRGQRSEIRDQRAESREQRAESRPFSILPLLSAGAASAMNASSISLTSHCFTAKHGRGGE